MRVGDSVTIWLDYLSIFCKLQQQQNHAPKHTKFVKVGKYLDRQKIYPKTAKCLGNFALGSIPSPDTRKMYK